MEAIPWRASYETGVAMLDEQHKALISIINRLYKVIRNKQGVDDLQVVFDDLTAYATTHLEVEENLLAEHNYPDLEKHRQRHKEYIARVEELSQGMKSADDKLVVEVYSYLRQWWLNHIVVDDKAYGPYLNEQGVE